MAREAVQGYFNGAIRIASPNCNIAESRNYTNSSKITVSIPPFQGNCLIVATMSPVFPNEKGSGITVSSIRGLFALRRDSLARQWVGRVGKLSFPAAGTFTIPVGPITTGQVNLNGCGIDYSAPVNVFNKQAVLKYQDFIKQGSWSNCIADGFLSSKDYQDLLINALLITYSNSFTPLPTPTFSIKNDKLTVIGDAAVSAIYVDDTYQIAASIEVPFDSSVAHTVRLLTAKGRTVIGFWNPAKKDFTWMQ